MYLGANKQDFSLLPRTSLGGGKTGIEENWRTSIDQQILNESFLGYNAEYEKRDAVNRERIKQLTGEEVEPVYTQSAIMTKDVFQQQQASAKRIEELSRQFPEIKTREQIKKDIQDTAQKLEKRSYDVSERATFMGSVAGFAGSVAASFNPETDPINVASLGIGGVGKTAMLRILTEMGFNSAVETINQFTGVSANRKKLGLDNSSQRMLTNIAAAGVGAGILRGIGEGAGAGIRKLRDKYGEKLPQTPASKLLDDFEPDGTSTDNVVNFALQREAIDEPILSEVKPATAQQMNAKIAAAEESIITGKPLDEVGFPPDNPNAAAIEFKNIADTFDLDIQKAEEYYQANVRVADEKLTAQDIAILTGREPVTLSRFIEDMPGIKKEEFEGALKEIGGDSDIFYHGTAFGDFDEFDPSRGRYGLMGQGSYFTDNVKIALEYTEKGVNKGKVKTSKQVFSAKLNIKDPLDMDAKADIDRWVQGFPTRISKDEIISDLGENPTNEDVFRYIEDIIEDEHLPDYEAGEIIQDGIEYNMRHDGITHIGGGRVRKDSVKHKVMIAFHPEQIKVTSKTAPPESFIDNEKIAEELFDAGYFPEKARPSEITRADIDEAIKMEAEGQPRFALADVNDALDAKGYNQESFDAYHRETSLDAKQREDALLEAYEGSEVPQLQRELDEIALDTRDTQTIRVETKDGEFKNIKLKDLLDDLSNEKAVLDAMKVCGI